MSDDPKPELPTEAQQYLDLISGVIRDPEALARAFGSWLRTRFPDRLAEAMWVTLEGDHDKGFEVRIYERKLARWPSLKARLNAMLGIKTAGFDVSVDVAKMANGATVAIGAGVVAPYSNLKELAPVAVLSVRF